MTASKARSAPQRIAEFLIELAPKPKGRPIAIEFPFEKGLVANRLGMRTESLSRALAKLSQLGVRVEKEIVLIDDLGNLRQFVRYAGERGGEKTARAGLLNVVQAYCGRYCRHPSVQDQLLMLRLTRS